MKKLKNLILYMFLLLASGNASGQVEKHVYQNEIFNSNIATLLTHVKGWELSYPVISFRSAEKINVSFDFLGSETPTLQYRLIHCTAEWEKSDLFPIEYIDGFSQGDISVQTAEFTVEDYSHYSFCLPDENAKLLKSGNYLVQVFFEESQSLLFQRRFCVTESTAAIAAEVKRAMIVEFSDEFQEVDVLINTLDLKVLDPFTDIKLVILQNGDWNFAKTGLLPRFVNQNKLDYDYEEGNLFQGGNENRKFVTKSFTYRMPEIEHFRLLPEGNEIDLAPVEDRQFLLYSTVEDMNGKYFITRDDADDAGVDADYAKVKFTLKHDKPVLDGYVCLYGQLTDWKCDSAQQLQYDYDKNIYTGELYLKQGYYDYKFAVVREYDPAIDLTYFEGSHFETENDYQVLVYFKDHFSGYDRLVGYKLVNSSKIEP